MINKTSAAILCAILSSSCVGFPNSGRSGSRVKDISYDQLSTAVKQMWAYGSGQYVDVRPKNGKWQVCYLNLTKKSPISDQSGISPYEVNLKFEDDGTVTVGGFEESRTKEFAVNKWGGGSVFFWTACVGKLEPVTIADDSSCLIERLTIISATQLFSKTGTVAQTQALWVSN